MENSTLLNRSKKTSLPEHSVLLPMMQLIWRPLATLAGIHKQYGELVLGRLLGRNILFVCDPEYIEQIFNLEGKGQLNRNFLYDAKKSLFGNGLVNSESQVWSKQRRLMQPLFTKDTVKNYELIMVEEAAAMAEELKKAASGQVDLSTEIKRLIQRIFIRILLGKSVDQLSNGAELIKVIEIICQELPVQLGSEIVLGRRLKRFFPLKSKRYLTAVNYLQTFIGAEIAQTRKSPGQSLISQLMQASDRSTGYTMPDNLLQDEAVNLFFAGQETTINTLVWFFLFNRQAPGSARQDRRRNLQLAERNLKLGALGPAELYQSGVERNPAPVSAHFGAVHANRSGHRAGGLRDSRRHHRVIEHAHHPP